MNTTFKWMIVCAAFTWKKTSFSCGFCLVFCLFSNSDWGSLKPSLRSKNPTRIKWPLLLLKIVQMAWLALQRICEMCPWFGRKRWTYSGLIKQQQTKKTQRTNSLPAVAWKKECTRGCGIWPAAWKRNTELVPVDWKTNMKLEPWDELDLLPVAWEE